MSGYRDFHMTRFRAGVTLGLTVVCEVTATLCVKASDGLTEVLPSAGAVAVPVLGVALFGDHHTSLAWLGIGLVVLGVGTLNLQPGRPRSRRSTEGA